MTGAPVVAGCLCDECMGEGYPFRVVVDNPMGVPIQPPLVATGNQVEVVVAGKAKNVANSNRGHLHMLEVAVGEEDSPCCTLCHTSHSQHMMAVAGVGEDTPVRTDGPSSVGAAVAAADQSQRDAEVAQVCRHQDRNHHSVQGRRVQPRD